MGNINYCQYTTFVTQMTASEFAIYVLTAMFENNFFRCGELKF